MKKKIALFLICVNLILLISCAKPLEADKTREAQASAQDTAAETEEIGTSPQTEEEKKTENFENMTVGEILFREFQKNTNDSALEIAQRLAEHEIIPFMGVSVPVEEGYLAGFDNFTVSGFEEGAMFGPMISAIPFVGYVFTLPEGSDVEEFKKGLAENANLRWAISVEAEEMVVESEGDKVFFVMTKREFK